MPEPVPTKPVRQFSFEGHTLTQPTVPLPGASVDTEINRTNTAVTQTINFVRQVIDDDGTIKANAALSLIGPQGATGPGGPLGPTGPQGIQGGTGPTGAQGTQGVQGIQGVAGDSFAPDVVAPATSMSTYDGEAEGFSFLDTTNGWLFFKRSATSGDWTPGVAFGRGPQGLQGIQGIQGIQGETGPQGIQGETGDTGAQGPTGATGGAGATGATGDAGATGDTGATGPEGPQGDDGPQGIQGETGPTGPVGPPGDISDAADMATAVNGSTAKTSLVDADQFFIADSAASNGPKKVLWSVLAAQLWGKLGALISGGTAKTTVVAADTIAIADSAATNATKKVTFTTISTFFKGLGGLTLVAGDLLYASGANVLAKLAKGTDGQVLTLASGAPSWADAAGGGGGLLPYLATTALYSGSGYAITGLPDCTQLEVRCKSVRHDSNYYDETFQIGLSNNGGSNYTYYDVVSIADGSYAHGTIRVVLDGTSLSVVWIYTDNKCVIATGTFTGPIDAIRLRFDGEDFNGQGGHSNAWVFGA